MAAFTNAGPVEFGEEAVTSIERNPTYACHNIQGTDILKNVIGDLEGQMENISPNPFS